MFFTVGNPGTVPSAVDTRDYGGSIVKYMNLMICIMLNLRITVVSNVFSFVLQADRSAMSRKRL